MRKLEASKPRRTTKREAVPTGEQVCFIISPIGAEGTEKHQKFKEVLEYLIKPAVKDSGYSFMVVRADDIERSGSFIKDILTSLLDSFVVVADLTEQNPNVFYELGVRHALSPRTILIAQSIDYIPFDLREYRTIVYDTTLSGAATFSKRLTNYLKQIFDEPHRADNPVLDRLQSIIEEKTIQLETENTELKKQVSNLLKKGVPEETKSSDEEPVERRMDRILKVLGAERSILGVFYRDIKEGQERYELPTREGSFNLYAISDGTYISDYWYVAMHEQIHNLEKELADIRVLMGLCSQGQGVECNFAIVTNEDISKKIHLVKKAFNKMKAFLKPDERELFNLDVWDKTGLLAKEKELGIKIDLKLS